MGEIRMKREREQCIDQRSRCEITLNVSRLPILPVRGYICHTSRVLILPFLPLSIEIGAATAARLSSLACAMSDATRAIRVEGWLPRRGSLLWLLQFPCFQPIASLLFLTRSLLFYFSLSHLFSFSFRQPMFIDHPQRHRPIYPNMYMYTWMDTYIYRVFTISSHSMRVADFVVYIYKKKEKTNIGLLSNGFSRVGESYQENGEMYTQMF